jgi:hypothetical protein
MFSRPTLTISLAFATLALLGTGLGLSFALASGGSAAEEYEMSVRFNASVTQADIDEVSTFLGADVLMPGCGPPVGVAVVTTDEPASIAADLEAKSYVDEVSFQLRDESNHAEPGTSGEVQDTARCG